MASFCYAMTSFCCDLILDVHYDIITSEMMQPAVVFDATLIFNYLVFLNKTERQNYSTERHLDH